MSLAGLHEAYAFAAERPGQRWSTDRVAIKPGTAAYRGNARILSGNVLRVLDANRPAREVRS